MPSGRNYWSRVVVPVGVHIPGLRVVTAVSTTSMSAVVFAYQVTTVGAIQRVADDETGTERNGVDESGAEPVAVHRLLVLRLLYHNHLWRLLNSNWLIRWKRTWPIANNGGGYRRSSRPDYFDVCDQGVNFNIDTLTLVQRPDLGRLALIDPIAALFLPLLIIPPLLFFRGWRWREVAFRPSRAFRTDLTLRPLWTRWTLRADGSRCACRRRSLHSEHHRVEVRVVGNLRWFCTEVNAENHNCPEHKHPE